MGEQKMVISYDGIPLVIIEHTEFSLPHEVLNWYAKEYAFDRSKLTWAYVPTVKIL